MKKFFIFVMIFGFLFSLQAAEKITRLGQHPFYKSKDVQPGDLKKIALERPGDVKMGFEEAGYGELVFAFLEQIQKADIRTTELNPGDTLQWMLYKKGKKVMVLKDAVYEGKKPASAYTFVIFRDGKTYEFIVPKICANISLKDTREVPAPACALALAASEVEAGKPVKVDVCASQNALKTTVEVSDPAGAVVKTVDLTPANCSTEITLDKAGEYSVTAVSEGQYGMKSTNSCKTTLKVIPAAPVLPTTSIVSATPGSAGSAGSQEKYGISKPLAFLLEAGPGVVKGTYTGMVWARAGVLGKLIPDTLDFVLAVGGGMPVKGSPWKSFFMGNALLSLHAGTAYLGGGLGFSSKEREDRKGGIDLVGQVGVNLFRAGTGIGSIFGELRAPVITSDRPFAEHHKLLLGFRYIF